MHIYDAIIIGAGPAGLMAARELDANKVNYLIIEAKNKIGSPLKCGEITRQDTFLELFEHTDYPFIKNRISNISFRVICGLTSYLLGFKLHLISFYPHKQHISRNSNFSPSVLLTHRKTRKPTYENHHRAV